MSEFTIYNTKTGKITRHSTCPESYGGLQYLESDEDLVSGHYDYTYRINPETFEAEKIGLPNPEVPAYHLSDLQQYIESDVFLNQAIENMGEDPVTYRVLNYKRFRVWSYPPMEDSLDAQVKQSSSDTNIRDRGTMEMALYNQSCLDVKSRFPKE